MSVHNPMSHLSSAALLDALGLQPKSSAASRALTYGALLLAGAAVGAAAALLLAPKSGRALRSDLREGATELGGQVNHAATHALQAAKSMVAEHRPHFGGNSATAPTDKS